MKVFRRCFHAHSKALKFFVFLLLGIVGVGGIARRVSNHGIMMLESEESKTLKDEPVFNRIRLLASADQDVWLMQQSHHGVNASADKWDRLAIVVDKSKSQKTAWFAQFEPGPLEWNGSMRRIDFRVSCFMCHPNGPRAIRPNTLSAQVGLSIIDRLQIFAWNMRIKSYGRVLYDSMHDGEDRTAATPFRLRGKIENDRLTVKSCVRCHNEEGLVQRGFLLRQNSVTIRFMTSTGHMPPLFKLAKHERKLIENFINGF